MNRRSFLRGLLALPLVPLAAKLLPKPPSLLDYADAHPSVPAVVESTPWASGSDQTSIWLINWGDKRAAEDDKFIAKFTEQLTFNRNWLKESIHGS